MMLGPKDTGAFTSSGNCPLLQCPQEHLTCIVMWLTTVAAIGSGMSTTWRVALTIAASISSGFPHSGHTETGYHCWVSVTFSDWSRVLPEWPFCPPDFLPEGLRRDCVCRMPIGFPEGGTLLFVLFFMTGFLPLQSSATWDANSAIRASLTFISLSRTERIRSIRASSLSFSSRVLTRALLIFACTSSRSASSVESSSSQRPSKSEERRVGKECRAGGSRYL